MPDEIIKLIGDDGEEIDLYVVEETRISDISYLLTSDSTDENAQFYILKDLSAPEDTDAVYEFVEDDEEWDAVAGIFDQLLNGEE